MLGAMVIVIYTRVGKHRSTHYERKQASTTVGHLIRRKVFGGAIGIHPCIQQQLAHALVVLIDGAVDAIWW